MAKKKEPDHEPARATAASVEQLRRFETALGEVESIVSRLEGGQLDLADSLEQYQRGIQTLQECHRLLAGAERQITLLSGFDADGNPVTEPFDQSDASPSEKQARRGKRRGATSAEPASASPDDPLGETPGLF